MENRIAVTETLLLASSSPRRIELLRGLGIDIEILPSDVDETRFDSLPVSRRVVALAELKARTSVGLWRSGRAGAVMPRIALGADTLVSLGNATLGKPESEDEAYAMLRLLSGAEHTVSTGIFAIETSSGRVESALSETKVIFADMTDSEIGAYIGSGEWRGAAGAYRIQGLASYFVTRIDGSYSGVVGLPLHLFYAILSRLSFAFPYGRRADAASGIRSGAESSAV